MKQKIAIGLLSCLLLTGCSSPAQTPVSSTPASATTPALTTTAPTQPPVDPTPEATTVSPVTTPAPAQPQLAQGSIDTAPGTVLFSIGGVQVFCGQPVSQALVQAVDLDGDREELVQPGSHSRQVRLRFLREDGGKDTVYLVALNPTQEPLPLKDCPIYSLAFNFEKGLGFSLGDTAFVTGSTTDEEVLAAWPEPGYDATTSEGYRDLVYYTPLSLLQIICQKGSVVQVRACHSAHLYPELAQAQLGDHTNGEALAHLSRYLDLEPYLQGTKGPERELPLSVTIQEKEITLGVKPAQLPEPWASRYQKGKSQLDAKHYVYSQYPGIEGFTFANESWNETTVFTETTVKGIHAFNPDYTGWGTEQATMGGFAYAGFTHTDTITQVMEALGAPYEIVPASGTGWCFVWLHYQSPKGDTLRIKADPVTGQLVELRLEMYIDGVVPY